MIDLKIRHPQGDDVIATCKPAYFQPCRHLCSLSLSDANESRVYGKPQHTEVCHANIPKCELPRNCQIYNLYCYLRFMEVFN